MQKVAEFGAHCYRQFLQKLFLLVEFGLVDAFEHIIQHFLRSLHLQGARKIPQKVLPPPPLHPK